MDVCRTEERPLRASLIPTICLSRPPRRSHAARLRNGCPVVPHIQTPRIRFPGEEPGVPSAIRRRRSRAPDVGVAHDDGSHRLVPVGRVRIMRITCRCDVPERDGMLVAHSQGARRRPAGDVYRSTILGGPHAAHIVFVHGHVDHGLSPMIRRLRGAPAEWPGSDTSVHPNRE